MTTTAMNPMNLMLAPAPAAITPSGSTPPRGGPSEGGFAQCLGQAAEPKTPKVTDAAEAADTNATTDTTTDASDPASDTRPARGPRRALPVGQATRKPEPSPALGCSSATTPCMTPAEGVGQAETLPDATTAAKAKPAAEGESVLAQLLPGWPATPPSAPAAAATTPSPMPACQGAEPTLAAAVPTGPSAPQAAQIEALVSGTPAPKAKDPTSPAPFALPPQAAPTLVARALASETPPAVQADVAAPVDSPAFAPALATQVRWLVRDGLQHAQLSLNPAEMGPVTVQIVLDGREARIDFRADLAATRHAIESSLPVLAAALDDSGLRLAGGGVHDGHASRQGQPGWAMSRGQAAPGAPAHDGAPLQTSARIAGPARGLVDLVA